MIWFLPNIPTLCPESSLLFSNYLKLLDYAEVSLLSCLCLMVPAWNVLSWLACMMKLCSCLQTQFRSIVFAEMSQRESVHLFWLHTAPRAPYDPGVRSFSVPAPFPCFFLTVIKGLGHLASLSPLCLAWLQTCAKHAVTVIIWWNV